MKQFISSRIKITKGGKILRRKMGQSHFLAKKRRIQIRRKKRLKTLNYGKKIIKKS